MVRIGVLLAFAALTLAALARGAAAASQYRIPEPTWFRGMDTELQELNGAFGGGGRKLLQPGVFTPGHTGLTTCTITIVGTGALNGVKSAKVTCTTTDNYWKTHNGGKILVYAGTPLYNLYKSQPANWVGIQLALPNEANFLGTGNGDSVLFFVQGGNIKLKGSVTGISTNNWAVTHIENGTTATFQDFTWQNLVGKYFPSLAAARSAVYVESSKFLNNVCDISSCHTPGVYISEGGRLSIVGTTFQGGKGHLAGAVMITAGAIGVIENSTFKSNQVTVDGSFGGAIFHDSCTSDSRVGTDKSLFMGNVFEDNTSQGFGGAIRLGSTNGGCPKTNITGNKFTSNSAKYTGGAIDIAYCHGIRSTFEHNSFVSNKATKFNCQIAYNPLVYATGQPNAGKPTPSGTGCQNPIVTYSTFTGAGTVTYPNPNWYFP